MPVMLEWGLCNVVFGERGLVRGQPEWTVVRILLVLSGSARPMNIFLRRTVKQNWIKQ
jgi:hypothetical protein